jgi:hypothetical protein
VSNRSRICRCVAALDYWYAHRIPPVDQPSPGTPLYRFIVRRIVDSWNIPVGVAQYFTWMNLPDADTGFDVLGRHVTVDRGISGRTVLQQWPLVKHDLDQGSPSPLGIVTTHSNQLADLGLNHQVLPTPTQRRSTRSRCACVTPVDTHGAEGDQIRQPDDRSLPVTALPELPTTAVALGATALAPPASWPGSLLGAHLANQQKNDAVGPAL